ncbi:NAD(P)/FAD-dependent oxidoreductase [Limibaculum sp. M0105]|uniref:Pyridine nucleotide-disulfide oxidoreductase domain-containing protein 2 n=1 Tax=Thermohalobaculum xanthum TaxID=2753746 RepID=A0A8J7M6P9_9RHOB|nr:NAD(P)/FAD-dependent oxidoreductase [Thermohalobaculum xanthum]MBK0399190.1 NAD(P)/FAD-dependent oxidoreductase [Thermohalobaculum xanthum]
MAFDHNRRPRAVVIGAGVNGLAAAATLAARGVDVTVVERGRGPGGMMTGAGQGELGHFVWNLHPAALAELGLGAADLGLGAEVATVLLAADGRHVVIEGEAISFADGTPHPDAAAYRALRARLARFAAVLAPLATAAPPRLGSGMLNRAGLSDLAQLARTGLGLRRLPRDARREFLRVLLSNAADLVRDELPDGPLAASLVFDAILGGRAAPGAPGTVLALLWRHAGGGRRRPAGGMAALARRIAGAAEARGVTIRYDATAAGIEVEGDRVRGLRLGSGEVIAAEMVLSSLGAMPTLRLAGPAHFDAEACRRIRGLRCEGTTARLDLRLAEMPRIEGLDGRLAGARLLLAPSVAAIEAACRPVKYGAIPASPVAEVLIEPGDGGAEGPAHLSALVQHVPYAPECGWTEAAREALAAAVIGALGTHMPGLPGLVTESRLATPRDIETMTGAPGGHWHHAELAADQMLTLRPVNGMARYASSLPGLWFCGAGAHPGGDITGLPGRNAALAAAADLGQGVTR